MRDVDKGDAVVGRVLSGPCASGHGGQVTIEENSHDPKADFGPELFSKRKGPPLRSHASPTARLDGISDRIHHVVEGKTVDRHSECWGND